MKRTKGNIGWTMLLVALLLSATVCMLTACSSDDTIPTPNNTPASEILMDANVWQVMEGTRATTFDNDAALRGETGGFKCAIYYENTTNQYLDYTTVNWSGSQWLWSDGKHYWPPSDNLDFFAYMPATKPSYVSSITNAIIGTGSGNEPQPYFTCANLPLTLTPIDATKEFIWALTRGQNKTDNASGVTMNFKHPFARIKFKLSAASGTNVTVNSITIPGVYPNGKCTLAGTGNTATCTWSNLSDSSNNLIISGTPATNDDVVYLVIPNNYGSKTLTANATWSDWSTATKNVSTSVVFNWEAGNSYTYTLTLSKEGLIVDTSKYTEQW